MTSPRHPLAIWAPWPKRLRIVVSHDGGDAAEHELIRGDGDWWAPAPGDLTDVASDLRYAYRIDDEERALPDPRSRRQPDGVHEASQRFDPSMYEWGDGDWTGRQLAGGSIYEMHIGTFTPTGTLDSAIQRLDHIASLGVSHVEVLPVNAFNGTHNWGYDGVLWFAVQETYGGPAAYQRFVDACHQRGLAVIQDVVYNHLGPSGNYLPRFGPYLAEQGANTWGASVNLDGPHSDEVRRYILDNALMWLNDYHVDGLRLDAVHALADHSAVHLLEEMAIEVGALSAHLGKPLPLIAESDLNDPHLITAREAHGSGLDAQWDDDFHHSLHVALTGETTGYYSDFASLDALAKVYEYGFFHNGTMSTFRGRHHGRSIDRERMPTSRLVTFAQDHDQIGNRAIGDRLSAGLSPARLSVGAVLNLMTPFTPMLFMGEEWGAATPWQFFTSHPEKDLGEMTAKGRIAEFASMGWDPSVVPDPQDPETFRRSKLDWSEIGHTQHAALLDLHRRLLRLRGELPELVDPSFFATTASVVGDAIVIRRGSTTIAANLGATDAELDISGEVLLTTSPAVIADSGRLQLPPDSAAILRS